MDLDSLRRFRSAAVTVTVGAATVCVALAVPAAAGPDPSHAAARPATVPGLPGEPQAPTTLFTEDFQHNQGTTPIRLNNYTGAQGMRYTADPPWLVNCNGWLAAHIQPPGDNAAVAAQVRDCNPTTGPGSTGTTAWNNVRLLAQALGVLNGTLNTRNNHAVSAYTNGPVNNGNPGANYIEFATATPIPLQVHDQFLQFSANVAEMSCGPAHNPALLDFQLMDGATPHQVTSTPVSPCASGQVIATGIRAGTLIGDSPVLFTGSAVGLRMINRQGSGNGNDHAFDDVKLLDVTPQLDKSFFPATAQVGNPTTLTFTITNTTDFEAKNGWSFSDKLPAGLTLTGTPPTTDCPGGVVTPSGDGTEVSVTGSLNAGSGNSSCQVHVQVIAHASGTYTNDALNVTTSGLNPPGTASVTYSDEPVLGLQKSASPRWFSADGQMLRYEYLVSNPSSVPITGITIADNKLADPVHCPDLAPDTSETCYADYQITPGDITDGSVTNTATATGTPNGGAPIDSNEATDTVPSLKGALTLKKSAVPRSFETDGQLIAYRFLVTNHSPLAMSNVEVNDTDVNGLSDIVCPERTLAPEDSEVCVASYTTIPEDVERGYIHNEATAQGTPPDSQTPVVSEPSDVTVRAVETSIGLAKYAAPPHFDRVGQHIRFSYRVTNSGHEAVDGLGIKDPLHGLSHVHCPSPKLQPGISETCTADYHTTPADLHAEEVTNVAMAFGYLEDSATLVESGPAEAVVTVPPGTALSLRKLASPSSFHRVGQVIHYTYRVTNTGDVTLSHVLVRDPLRGLSALHCPHAVLAPKASQTCTATYRITSADMRAGSVRNRAVAQGNPAGSRVPLLSRPSAVTIFMAVPVTG